MVNTAPRFTYLKNNFICAYANKPFDLNLNTFFQDAEGNDLTFSISESPAGYLASVGISQQQNKYLVGNAPGQSGNGVTLTITASDGALSATGTVRFKKANMV